MNKKMKMNDVMGNVEFNKNFEGEPIACPFCGQRGNVTATVLTIMTYKKTDCKVYTNGLDITNGAGDVEEVSLFDVIGDVSECLMKPIKFKCSCGQKWAKFEYELLKDDKGFLYFSKVDNRGK